MLSDSRSLYVAHSGNYLLSVFVIDVAVAVVV